MKGLLLALTIWLVRVTVIASASNPASGHLIAKTPVDRLHMRFNQTLAQISREARLGKITKDQAKSLKAQVETIRKQEITDLKQDNSKTLTDAQLSQLNQQLNNLSKSIPVR